MVHEEQSKGYGQPQAPTAQINLRSLSTVKNRFVVLTMGASSSLEISKVAGNWSGRKVFAKIDENGNVIPAGTKFAKDQLSQWFRSFVGRLPSTDELRALKDVWGRSGHVDITR